MKRTIGLVGLAVCVSLLIMIMAALMVGTIGCTATAIASPPGGGPGGGGNGVTIQTDYWGHESYQETYSDYDEIKIGVSWTGNTGTLEEYSNELGFERLNQSPTVLDDRFGNYGPTSSPSTSSTGSWEYRNGNYRGADHAYFESWIHSYLYHDPQQTGDIQSAYWEIQITKDGGAKWIATANLDKLYDGGNVTWTGDCTYVDDDLGNPMITIDNYYWMGTEFTCGTGWNLKLYYDDADPYPNVQNAHEPTYGAGLSSVTRVYTSANSEGWRAHSSVYVLNSAYADAQGYYHCRLAIMTSGGVLKACSDEVLLGPF